MEKIAITIAAILVTLVAPAQEGYWISYAESWHFNYYGDSSYIGDIKGMQLFPDTQVYATSGQDYYFRPFAHMVADVVDVNSFEFQITPGLNPSDCNNYLLDSMSVRYHYKRNTADHIVDTMLIYLWDNDTEGNVEEDILLDVSYVDTLRYKKLGYDYVNHQPVRSGDLQPLPGMKIIKVPLTVNDTTPYIGEKKIEIPGGWKPDLSRFIYSALSFKPGYTYSLNDTLTSLNSFTLIALDETAGSSPIVYNAGDYNAAFIIPSEVRYNNANSFKGVFVPAYAYTVGYSYHHYMISYHIKTVPVDSLAELNAPNDTSVCHEDSLILKASATKGYNVNWNINGTIVQDSSVTVKPATSQLYEVFLTREGCEQKQFLKDTVHVQIYTSPEIAVNPEKGICLGDSATLSLKGALSVKWNSGETASVIKVSPDDTAYYEVTLIDTNNCKYVKSTTIDVFPLPSADAGTDQVICLGDTAILNASGGVSYEWSTGQKVNSIEVSPENDKYYSLTVWNIHNCLDHDTVEVKVNLLPLVKIGSGMTDTVCAGDTVTLTASGASSYLWNTKEVTASITVTSTADYSVLGTDTNGCVYSDTLSMHFVQNNITPSICIVTVDTTAGKNLIVWEKDAPGTVMFNLYKESIQAGQYKLIGQIAAKDFSTFIDSTSNPAQRAARYKITAIDTCNNESVLSDHHKTVHLTINKGVNQSWNLIWNGYEGFKFSTYDILRGTSPQNMVKIDEIQSSLTSYTDLTPPAGRLYYAIRIVNTGNCQPSFKNEANYGSSISNIAVTDIIDHVNFSTTFAEQVRIFPNPGTGMVNLVLPETEIGKFTITLQNLIGQTVYSQRIGETEERYNYNFDWSGYNECTYILRISTIHGEIVKKLVFY